MESLLRPSRKPKGLSRKESSSSIKDGRDLHQNLKSLHCDSHIETCQCLYIHVIDVVDQCIKLWGKTMKVYCYFFQSKASCCLWALLTGGEKAFASAMSMYQVPGNVLTSSRNKTTSGSGAAVKSPYLGELMITHCPYSGSICLLHRPNGCIEWGCDEDHYTAFFKFLIIVLISTIPPGIWYCFSFTIFF